VKLGKKASENCALVSEDYWGETIKSQAFLNVINSSRSQELGRC
jgi:hypothetical protein